jgi:hypothetical protein
MEKKPEKSEEKIAKKAYFEILFEKILYVCKQKRDVFLYISL